MKIYIKILFLILIISFLFPIIILATSNNAVNVTQNIISNESELNNELENVSSSVSDSTNDTIYAYVTNSQSGLSVSDIINIILIAVCIVQVLLSIAILIRLK